MVYRVDDTTAVATPPTLPAKETGQPGYFTNGDPASGQPATVVPAWWLNMVQEELASVCNQAGIPLEKTDNSQLATAINALFVKALNKTGFAQNSDLTTEIQRAEKAEADLSSSLSAAQKALTSEQQAREAGDAGLAQSLASETQTRLANEVPVGVPLPWPSNTMPEGWILCDGRTFTASQYPKLAPLYPNGVIPDLRGMFIRGLDTSGNIDNIAGGRQLLSFEEGSRIAADPLSDVGYLNNIERYPGGRLGGMQALGWDISQNKTETFSGVHGYGQGQEPASFQGSYTLPLGITRPKNIAFNYIIRAA